MHSLWFVQWDFTRRDHPRNPGGVSGSGPVNFLPTCVLFPFLRVFRCFGWFEAVRGRLIGPKTWDRTCGIFLRFVEMAVTAQKVRGCLGL